MITQPDSVRSRAGAEHWVAHLYLRDVSPYLTRILLRLGMSANGVTWLMILTAALAAVVTSWPSVIAAVAVVVLAQLQMLFDCCDGEVARWRGTSSGEGGVPRPLGALRRGMRHRGGLGYQSYG